MAHGDNVKRTILDAALKTWPDVSYRAVGKAADMTHSNVFYHFPDGLEDAVIEHAHAVGDRKMIQKLIVSEHESTAHMNAEAKASWFEGV